VSDESSLVTCVSGVCCAAGFSRGGGAVGAVSPDLDPRA
jgi:hypothetical protein